ncbi:MAG: SpoIIE family protein phosphatase [Lachnospiraceae bacterium]|nr:SpoIIE family protein phosphatase [Lachnospiraceae bacterium]
MEKTLSSKNSHRNKNLIFVVVTAVIAMFAAAVFSCGLFMSGMISQMAENLVGDMLKIEAERCFITVQEFYSLPSLLDYWSEHSDTIDRDLYSINKLETRIAEIGHTNLLIDRCDVTDEEFASMDPVEQDVFANYCFLCCRIETDTEKNARVPITTKCVRFSDDGEYLFFYDDNTVYQFKTESDDILQSYPLTKDLSAYYKKAVNDMLTGADTSYFRTLGSEDLLVYCIPIIKDGETVCLIVSYADRGLIARITTNLLEGILPGCILVIILMAIILVLILRTNVVRPVELLQDTVQDYSETKNSADINRKLGKLIGENNEFGALASEFNNMALSIDSYVDEIRTAASEKEKMLAELNTAKEIQSSQLPSEFPAFPDRKDFDLYAVMDPALEVGGDFYDFFLLDDDHLVLVIGDVSDKGIPAALMMMVCKAHIRGAVGRENSLSDAMGRVNRLICENNSLGMFVTLWTAVIELSTGKGCAVNAGHEKPVIRRAGGKYELIKNQHNMALGAWEDEIFDEHAFELNKGDSVFVYTDGVPESTNESNELFGAERMLETLNKNPDAAPEEQIRGMLKEIADFVGEAKQFDDTTMLMFTRTGIVPDESSDK